MEPQVLVSSQVDDRHGPLDSHDDLTQALHDLDITGRTGAGPRSDEPNIPISPTSFNPPINALPTTSETASIPFLPSASVPSSSSSLPSPSCTPSLIFSSSDDSSPFISEDDTFFSERMCTPKEAKAISMQKDGYCAVTKREIGWKDEDDDCPEGMALEGYRKGVPIYYVTAGMDKKIKDQYTRTIIGSRIINRPVDTCLGTGWTSSDGTPPPNRTFANGFIVVNKSPLQGYGIFAAVDIEQHTHILVEKPFFNIKSWIQLDSEYAGLNEEEKAVFDGLVGYHRVHKDPVFKKYSANHFELAHGRQGVLAIASNFNHACYSRRNTQYAWDHRRQVMTFTAMKDVKKGQEVLISYNDHRSMLYSLYGFICHCGGCENKAYADDMYM